MFLRKTVHSESENENFNYYDVSECEANFPKKNFVNELIESVLIDGESENEQKTESTKEKALKLNQNMQKKLLEIRAELELMLKKCKEKYEKNDIFLNELNSQSTKQLKLFSRYSYNYCGISYFKDSDGYPAPSNPDYLYRRNNLKEFFPVDIIKRSIFWTLNDKALILVEIKNQIIEFLKQNAKIIESSSRKTRSRNTRISEINSKFDGKTLRDLLDYMKNEDFKINWYRVSLALDSFTEHRHSEISCAAMWNLYLHPSLNRSQWTEDEDQLLLRVAKNSNYQNWFEISKQIGDRSEFQCFIRYSSLMLQLNKKSQKWSQDEDALLLHAVENSRTNNKICWNLVQQYLPQRDKKALITRYCYSLDPNIVKRNFTPEEDCILLGAIEEYGENFSLIPMSLFPGRTSVQIRNRYRNTLQYVNKHQNWSIDDDTKLMDWVKENGTNKWSGLADMFGYHSRSSARQRYLTIKKFLNKHPNADLSTIPRKKRKQGTKITKENWIENYKELNMNKIPNAVIEIEDKSKQLTYINRLRTLEKDYYHFFKYSYDFKFSIKSPIFYLPIKNINFLSNIFNLQINSDIIASLSKNAFNKNELKCLKQIASKCSEYELNSEPNILLPPNWSSLLGLRGICIQCASTNEPDMINKDFPNISSSGVQAKEKFKERFRSIFYNTMLLTRLNVSQNNNLAKNNNCNILERSEIPQISNEEIGESYNSNTSSNRNFESISDSIKLNEDLIFVVDYTDIMERNIKKHHLDESDQELYQKNKILKIEEF